MACDAQTLINAAYANGYSKLSERALMEAATYSACSNTGGGGGSNQVVGYTNDPNTEALVPSNPNLEAIAASPNKPIYTWTIPAGPWV